MKDKSNIDNLWEKLSSAKSFTDTSIFSDHEYFDLLRRFHPAFRNVKTIDELGKLPVLYAKYYKQLLETIVSSSSNKLAEQEYAKQVILAISLFVYHARRAEEAEKTLVLIKKVSPGALEKAEYKEFQELGARLIKTGYKSPKKRKSAKLWWAWKLDFNWYAPHTVKEIEQAIQVSGQTIRNTFPNPKGRTKSGKAANTFQYSPDECLEILKWWLDHYLPRKTKKNSSRESGD